MKTYHKKPYWKKQYSAPAIVKDTVREVLNWSGEQLAIFAFFATGLGNLIVRARAGTGKTATIREAFNHVTDLNAKLLYMVFNKRNQLEAAGKISDPRVSVKTSHSLGWGFISKVWGRIKADNFVERDRVLMVCKDCPDEVITLVCKLVSFLKNGFIKPTLEQARDVQDFRGIECFGDFASWDARLPEIALKVLEVSKTRDAQGRISFDDMVWLPVAMGWVYPCFDLVCIDEAQDMNLVQITMAIQCCKPGGRIVLVGDDRQSIYGFRGAVQDGLDLFKAQLNASELGLTTTYRCPKSVVNLAKTIVPDYTFAPQAPDGIVDSMGLEKLLESAKVGDAILSRVNAPLMKLCLALLRKNVSARIEGRDIGMLLSNRAKYLGAKSIPDFLTKLENWRNKQISRAKGRYAQQKIDITNDEADTLQAIAEVATSVQDIQTRLQSMFQDSQDNPLPSVVLSSVHKAKGLEWPHVHLLQDTFNGGWAKTTEEVKQESNIYYVGITRAMQHLTMVNGSKLASNRATMP